MIQSSSPPSMEHVTIDILRISGVPFNTAKFRDRGVINQGVLNAYTKEERNFYGHDVSGQDTL